MLSSKLFFDKICYMFLKSLQMIWILHIPLFQVQFLKYFWVRFVYGLSLIWLVDEIQRL